MSPRHCAPPGLALLIATLVVLAGSVAVVGAVAPFHHHPSGETIVDRVEQRYESARTVTWDADVTVANDSERTNATIRFAAADPDQFRVVVTTGGETVSYGSNGTVEWFVGPGRAGVWPADLGPDASGIGESGFDGIDGSPAGFGGGAVPGGTTALNASNVTAERVGTPRIDGTQAYQVELTYPDSPVTRTLWVAQDDYRVLRAVTTDGDTRTQIDVRSTSFNVSIHPSTFQPPADRVAAAGLQRYDSFEGAQAATEIDLPRLTVGTFTEATITVRQGETIAAQRYDVDGEVVTVLSTTAGEQFTGTLTNATTAEVDGRTVQVATRGETSVAYWTDDGVTTAVVVDGPTERALELVEALDF